MQFITNGPDIPESLLQAHEEGRVVFFCGAGISYPAGLPSFKGLVDAIYQRVRATRTDIEQDAYDRGHFDGTLDLLERRLPGQRVAVRRALVQALQPNFRRKGAIDTHVALLQLAQCREGSIRLVTTNFDRIFERTARRTRTQFHSYAAPMLPIPKNSRWNGVVYLHGLLPANTDDSALHRLVLTSGDFGLAYLTERWAARFVSELFRNYVVCFVGYSINDPVLRYMMDALAADRMLGETTPQAYALGASEPGQEDQKAIEWQTRGVVPILYEVPTGSPDHAVFHQTLKVWAEMYRDGVSGKERVVVDYALSRPSASTLQDNFVGRMLWAVSDGSGLPAKRFADFNPAPPLEWLEPFSEGRFLHKDLVRFGVPPRATIDEKLRFSLVRRPAPYTHAPLMQMVSHGVSESAWDEVMFHIARWLIRHLNDPTLILWVAQHGSRLHGRWATLIEFQLDHIASLEQHNRTHELDAIRANAPNAIPISLMRTLWRLLLTGRVKSPTRDLDLYRWKTRFNRDGLTTTLRLELRNALTPKIALRRPIRLEADRKNAGQPTGIEDLLGWELVLSADNVHSWLRGHDDDQWRAALPELLEDLQQSLRDALDLLREIGKADKYRDRSHWDLPSISAHAQNRGFRDWVILIELLRDAWKIIHGNDPDRAARIAQGWFDLQYPTFKRLALFAASHGCIVADRWVEWLLGDGARWLWSVDTQRETMRLLVLQGGHLTPQPQAKLEAAILSGPLRQMYRADLDDTRWRDLFEQLVWLRLAKLNVSGVSLGSVARERFATLSAAHQDWQLSDNEREEFLHWMSVSGDADFNRWRKTENAPRDQRKLVEWLKKPPGKYPLYEDDWRQVCQDRFCHSCCALIELAKGNLWPDSRWQDALQVWSEKNSRVRRSWRFAAIAVKEMPDEVLKKLAFTVTWWLSSVAKLIEGQRDIFLGLCTRILALPLESDKNIGRDEETSGRPVDDAINHSIGHVARALLNVWFKGNPSDNDGLPADIAPLFTLLCDTHVDRYRHGRVLLAFELIGLFRVDRAWTEKYLLPLFDWSSSPTEAKAVWEGFLWSPRLYWPLLTAIKPQFLETAGHYSELGEHKRQFAAFLTHAALEPGNGFTVLDFRSAFETLPQDGLAEAAEALWQALDGAGEQREEYWRNKVRIFWQNVWPQSRDLVSPGIAESLARMSIAAREEFPSALSEIWNWLTPVEFPDFEVRLLHESKLCSRFPEDALRLLSAIIAEGVWLPEEFKQCLDAISNNGPRLTKDASFRRLSDYFRKREM